MVFFQLYVQNVRAALKTTAVGPAATKPHPERKTYFFMSRRNCIVYPPYMVHARIQRSSQDSKWALKKRLKNKRVPYKGRQKPRAVPMLGFFLSLFTPSIHWHILVIPSSYSKTIHGNFNENRLSTSEY